MTLREVLHAHVPTLSPTSTVQDAIDRMDIYQFPGLVVLSEDMKPIGVITEGDICRAIGQNESLASLRDIEAIKIATPDPTTMSPDTEISDALHLMLSTGITLLPIEEEQVFMGQVLRVDLMQAMLLDSNRGPE